MKMPRAVLYSALLLALTISAAAQTNVLILGPPPKPMTVQDVVRLSKAGLSDDTIVEQLRSKNQHFELSTDQIIQLKSAKVSERVIQTMINPAYKPTAQAAVTAKAPMPTMPPPEKKPAPPRSADPATDTKAVVPEGMPTELGVYARIKGEWTSLAPEAVSWKSGGLAKSVASGGIVKGDLNGYVDGTVSQYRVATPLELVIVVPEGLDITDYQLVRLHDRDGYRDFRTVTGGVFHVSGGSRDLLPFDSVKVAPRIYHVTISTALGEYGILPPGAFTSMNADSSGKIYSFGLVEQPPLSQ
jgi:hypothetical protein